MELHNAHALVLGASRGIGLAIARMLAAEGAILALTRHDWPEDSDRMEAEFAGLGRGHFTMAVDLREPDQVAGLAATIAERFCRLDVLINNVERGGMPVLHGGYDLPVNRDQWDLELATTLKAKQLVFHHCLPLLRKAPKAAVVNLSSIAGLVGRSGPAGLLFSDGYAAANRGVSALTETWARLGAPSIRVNELMLGIIDTRHGAGTRGWGLLKEEERRAILARTPLGRTGRPEEVAATVRFLLRDAVFMTGAVLRLDGGYLLGGEGATPLPAGILGKEEK